MGTMFLIPLESGVFFKYKHFGFENVFSKQIHLTTYTHMCTLVCLYILTLALPLRFVLKTHM